MRLTAVLPIGAVAFVYLASPAFAQPRSSIQGFGGMPLGGFASNDASFGGVVTSELTPSLQVVVEGGRIGNLLSPTIDLALGLIPGDLGFRTSAWYGQGGVRISTSGSGVRPVSRDAGRDCASADSYHRTRFWNRRCIDECGAPVPRRHVADRDDWRRPHFFRRRVRHRYRLSLPTHFLGQLGERAVDRTGRWT